MTGPAIDLQRHISALLTDDQTADMMSKAVGDALRTMNSLHDVQALTGCTIILTGALADGQKSTGGARQGCTCFRCFQAALAVLVHAFGVEMSEADFTSTIHPLH